jgi:hypothetical protein
MFGFSFGFSSTFMSTNCSKYGSRKVILCRLLDRFWKRMKKWLKNRGSLKNAWNSGIVVLHSGTIVLRSSYRRIVDHSTFLLLFRHYNYSTAFMTLLWLHHNVITFTEFLVRSFYDLSDYLYGDWHQIVIGICRTRGLKALTLTWVTSMFHIKYVDPVLGQYIYTVLWDLKCRE